MYGHMPDVLTHGHLLHAPVDLSADQHLLALPLPPGSFTSYLPTNPSYLLICPSLPPPPF